MEKQNTFALLPVDTPQDPGHQQYESAEAAVDAITERYQAAIAFLQTSFAAFLTTGTSTKKHRAFYPEIRVSIARHAKVDSRLSFGHFTDPGDYHSTITRPDLFRDYLIEQLSLIVENHGVPITVAQSNMPIPVHFALKSDAGTADHAADTARTLRDHFDVPDLSVIDDKIVNTGTTSDIRPLAPFTAPRVDYSLARLAHYTATKPEHFQNHVLFTNYQFYVEEFQAFAKAAIADPDSGYETLVDPGNVVHSACGVTGTPASKLPQMPTYHLTRPDNAGITLVNIGVGPSNAKTITDHIAVLRPHAWIMVGHCAGLRNSQSLGDYVLAHAYVREDHVLDDDLPTWVPIPALAEVQVALESAVAEVTSLTGFDLKRVMRTGTVATIDNRNWELRDQSGPVQRLSQSRAIALDMESATIAANGFRFRVPYGTLLCVSDKPLHGELKLPGMASEFYTRQVSQHLHIGIKAMETIRDMPLERLHSRKLRSFDETAFL